jgi:hypothetical protein
MVENLHHLYEDRDQEEFEEEDETYSNEDLEEPYFSSDMFF